MSRKPHAVVAMSGGVDSAVAAARLLESGVRVEGVSLRLWDPANPEDPRICSNARDAATVARELGIPHLVLDRREAFARRVVEPFARGYVQGRTPNPCPACNSDFKLGFLLRWALDRGADVVATGHYARTTVREGMVRLLRGHDRSRDQSYFLFQLVQEQLRRTVFPVGELTKEDVRAEARRFGLAVADKPQSQDLCLGSPAAFLRSRSAGGACGEVVDQSGRILGRHHGLEGFTVGQRRGLGIATGSPQYVQRLEAESGRVVVGSRPPATTVLVSRGWSWVAEPQEGPLAFQIRYRHEAVPGRLEAFGDGLRIRLDRPAFAVAPGQAVVAYRENEVVGGGWIDRSFEGERG